IVMANPNPEDPNVPNEYVSEEDPYHLLDYDKEEDLKMDIEEEEPEEDPGDQTPPPRDESSDSEFEAEEADDELEVEEASAEPEVEEAGVEPEVEEASDEPKAEGADVELRLRSLMVHRRPLLGLVSKGRLL
nr:hypothetical protein [Tanacetum cinerariifolium]